MSATNHTTTIELSQYISTDKPTYLTDYNGDMLKIDNAIAADREAITAAQSKANTADGKADANKTSIDTLGEQINGDPLVPSDTGLAGAVSANTGSINTINSLIGNGEPTTTDKTIIGAINELNADIVTPSTGIDARITAVDSKVGALTDLTTTEKSSAVGAINEVNSVAVSVKNKMVLDASTTTIHVTADGVKTYNALFDELYTLLGTTVSALAEGEYISPEIMSTPHGGVFPVEIQYFNSIPAGIQFVRSVASASALTIKTITLTSSSSYYEYAASTGTISDIGATIPVNGAEIFLTFRKAYKV